MSGFSHLVLTPLMLLRQALPAQQLLLVALAGEAARAQQKPPPRRHASTLSEWPGGRRS